MKKLLFCFLLFVTVTAQAQFDSSFARKQIMVCADSLSRGFVTKDWELFARYSYAPLIGVLGGKEQFIRQVSSSLNEISDTAWKKYQPGKVLQMLQSGRELQALVELFSVLEWQGIRVSTTHHLVAESWNGGQHWTFFDSQNDREKAILIKPDLSPLLIIPPKQEKMEPLAK
jgi:hypothetical protein